MVEVSEKDKETKKLRDRVLKLNMELDQCETRRQEAEAAFREALGVLATLAEPSLDKNQLKALKKLRKKCSDPKASPEGLQKAVTGFKNALLTGKGAGPAARAAAGGDAGRHVALALMEGLRLGDPEFDAELEKDIQDIQRLISDNQVRAAMVRTMDLIDRFRMVLERRGRQAETALKEVVGEVFKTEEIFADAMQEAQEGLVAAGRQFDDQVAASMGGLAKVIKGSDSLEAMKARALEHLRALREGMKARQEKEQSLLQATRRQLQQVRATLGQLRERMRQAERTSEEFCQQALRDPLTKLWNKRALTQRLEEVLANPQEAPVCLIIFDVDNFKGVNDNYGHQAGDKALQAIAERAGSALRPARASCASP